jgi:formate hydrogenlyase subunit 3/multisubunit Na+/H+ antiporter MnhD subunit
MLAYSSINTVGFILLGLQAGTARGVSASLYYLFVYTFMVIGSFAVVTILGRKGDKVADITSYRGLASRQPLLALSFAILLLAQAGAPFTTGLWAKLQVVLASVDANSVPLAIIAMVSAAIAAFFYLRVAVLMYTPLRAAGTAAGVEADAEDPVGSWSGPAARDDDTSEDIQPSALGGGGATPVWAGTEAAGRVMTRINAGILLDDETGTAAQNGTSTATNEVPSEADESALDRPEPDRPEPDQSELDQSIVPVPIAAAVAIGLCVAFTVVFGIFPAPIVDLAHKATLLF